MPEPVSLSSRYQKLREDLDKYRKRYDTLCGIMEEKKAQLEGYYDELKEQGLKNPEDKTARKKFIARKKKELLELITEKQEEVTDAISRLEGIDP